MSPDHYGESGERDAGGAWPVRLLRQLRALRRNARLYLLSNLLQAATTGAIVTLYTLYLAALGYKGLIGLALLFGTIGGALGIIPANPLVNRLGYRAMLIWADVIGGLAIAIQIVVPVPAVILVTSLGVGASVAVVFVVNTPLLTTYSTPAERTALLGLNGALNLLAGIIGSLLGGFLPVLFSNPAVANSPALVALRPLLVADPYARSLELAMLVSGLLALPSIIPIFMMREDAPSPAAESLMPPQLAGDGRTLRQRVASLIAAGHEIARGVIGRFTVTQALLGFGAGLFIPYVSLYFVEHFHQPTGFVGVLNAVSAAVLAAANLLSAWLAVRFGKVRGAVAAQAASVIFLLALGAVPILALATLAFLARSFLMALTGPPLQAFYMEAVPERSRVLASSVYNVAYQMVWAVGAAIGGLVSSVAGYTAVFFLAAPFYATSAILIARWFFGRDLGRSDTPLHAPARALRE